MEGLGIPTASIACDGFANLAKATAAALGMRDLPVASYPGPVRLHSVERLSRIVESMLVDQIVSCITVQPPEVQSASTEPGLRDVVFRGSFEETNGFFYDRRWSDGLPVVPPTIEKIEEFLKHTERPPGQVLGVLLPARREATIWSIAANGVMAGCRPEYMPVLVAIVDALADPAFGHAGLGHTPGTEALITLNGPIINDLGFNFGESALRVGFQANTSVGRFWRLYLRNVAGFLPYETDKATFGGTWRVVLAENEEAVTRMGWVPMSVDQGFRLGENVVTLSSCTSTDPLFSVGSPSVERILDRIAARLVDVQIPFFDSSFIKGTGIRPRILLSPVVAEAIASAGWSKGRAKQYLYSKAQFPAVRFEQLCPGHGSLFELANQKRLPQQYGVTNDPNRLVPICWAPDDIMITISGDPGRDNCLIGAQNGHIGYPVAKLIELPPNWAGLLARARGAR